MTKYWTENSCSINQNTIFSNWNAEGYRKGLYTELFFLFFVYFISQVLQSLMYKQHQRKMNTAEQRSLREGMTGNGNNNELLFIDSNDQQVIVKKELPWHSGRWNRQFAMIFSTNCIAVGMCVLFSPFAGSMTIAYIHLFLFFAFVFCELKLMIFPAKIVRICKCFFYYVVMDLCNLTLILIGTASINLNRCNGDFTCKGVNAGVLTQEICFG